MKSDSSSTPRHPRRAWIPFFALAVALLLTFVATYYARVTTETRNRLQFQKAVQQAQYNIQTRMDTYIASLRGGSALFAASQGVSRAEFHAFVERLDLTRSYPGIQGIGFSARIPAQESDAFIARMRQDGLQDFKIWPAEPARPDYFAIIYIEPMDQRNTKALGYDMFTEPTRRAAMERARDTGAASATAPVTLLQEITENKQAGFLIYVPVYHNGQPIGTPAEREAALAGFIYSPFRAGDLLAGIFGPEEDRSLDLQISDGESKPENWLYQSNTSNPSYQPLFVTRTQMQVAGRTWTLDFATRPEFEKATSLDLVPFILFGGLIISFTLFGLTYSQVRARTNVERAAREQKQSEQALRESESRLRRLVDASILGIVITDFKGHIFEANDAFLNIFGYTREEMSDPRKDWRELTPPEHRHLDQSALEEMRRTGKHAPYEKEFIRKDGTRVPVLVGTAYLGGPDDLGVRYVFDLTERKRAEEAIRFQAHLLDTVGQAVIATDLDGKIIYWNHFAEVLYGWTAVEVIGRSIMDVTPSRMSVESATEIMSTVRAGKRWSGEFIVQRRDGRDFPAMVTNSPIFNETGEVIGIVGVSFDISERKHAEEALKLSEESYRELFENANDMIYTLDLEGNLTSVNKAGEQFTGYSRDELLNQSIVKLIAPESVEKMQEMFSRKLKGEARTNYELDILARDGRKLTLEVSSRLIYEGPIPVGVQGIARDITERKRTAEVLREANQRAIIEYERLLERLNGLAQGFGTARDLVTIYRALREFSISSVPCVGIFISLYDPQREARTAAYAWGDGLEFDVSELPPMAITAAGPNSRAVKTGQPVITDDYMAATSASQGVIVGPDNGLRPQSSLVVPMSVMGRIVGTVEVQSYERAAYRDEHVTAMRMASNLAAVAIENFQLFERESRARAIAEESNRMKDEFLATVSHELRTPLTSILGWSRMLSAGALDAQTSSRALETIERNAKAQAQIIDDILDASRIITGKLRLEIEAVELVIIIESAINSVRPAAEAKGIQFEKTFDAHANLINGDASRLQQVVWNLLANAVKFTPTGGRIEVRLQKSNDEVEIVVSDTGQGINPKFLPYVFDRFRQADSSTTRMHGGLGLGLAIVRHLTELHGGTVHAESDGDGHGATFIVRLPLANVPEETAGVADTRAYADTSASTIPCHPSLAGLRVLVVDDEIDTCEMLRVILERCEVEVTTALSTREALAAIERIQPDVIISDIGMPEEDGYELVRRLRALSIAHGGDIPAIALTAYAAEDDRKRTLASGFQTHLAKPVEPSALLEAIAGFAQTVKQ